MSMYAYTMTGQAAWAPFAAEPGRGDEGWRQRLGILAVVAVLHGAVLAALLVPWRPDSPATPAAPALTVQLAMLAPAPAPPEAVPMSRPEPEPDPVPEPPAPAPEPEPPEPEPPKPAAPMPAKPEPAPAPALRKQPDPPPAPRPKPQARPSTPPQASTASTSASEAASASRPAAAQASAPTPSMDAQLAALAASSHYQPISKEAPAYPPRALQQQLEGDCTVRYTVSAQGLAQQPQIVGECHPLFVRPSLQAVATFRYRPHRIDGMAVAVPGVHNTFHYRIRR